LKLRIHGGESTAAIFDFDETMIDLEAQHTAASAALCREMGGDYFSLPDELRLASGRRIIDEIADMKARFGWTKSVEELLPIRQRYFRDACLGTHLELLPCVEKVVRELHANGLALAIATSAVRGEIEEILRRTGLRDCFAVIVDGSEVTRAKPDPEAYLVTAKKLGVGAEECVVFEDSAIGVQAAKAAGARCIAIRNRRAHFPQDLSGADVVLDSFCELMVG